MTANNNITADIFKISHKIASATFQTVLATCVTHFLCVMFGASFVENFEQTLTFSAFVSISAYLPLFIRFAGAEHKTLHYFFFGKWKLSSFPMVFMCCRTCVILNYIFIHLSIVLSALFSQYSRCCSIKTAIRVYL